MTDEELNKYLHEKIMGECWHDTTTLTKGKPCSKCDASWNEVHKWPLASETDYCGSLDAVAKVESHLAYRLAARISYPGFLREVVAEGLGDAADTFALVTATPRQRAEACKEAWETK